MILDKIDQEKENDDFSKDFMLDFAWPIDSLSSGTGLVSGVLEYILHGVKFVILLRKYLVNIK